MEIATKAPNTKRLSTEFKDFDDKKYIIKAYANAYGNEDSAGDISGKGSFNKTVKEQRRKLRVYKNHNPNWPIGIPLELNADNDFGLDTTTKFMIDDNNPADTIALAKDTFVFIKWTVNNDQDADLSIGYETMKRDEKDRRIIKEYKLWEYSFLTNWGANELATVQGLKSKQLMDYILQQYNLPYSDERLKNLEAALIALDKNEEPPKSTPKLIEPLSIGSFRILS
jgi:HK97 family phage prohead protease